jgi:hypothetical protein
MDLASEVQRLVLDVLAVVLSRRAYLYVTGAPGEALATARTRHPQEGFAETIVARDIFDSRIHTTCLSVRARSNCPDQSVRSEVAEDRREPPVGHPGVQ